MALYQLVNVDELRCTCYLHVTVNNAMSFCRLGEITLRDFKGMFDRQGNYRYHFKAMDPEFGTVKEEVSNELN